jgi:hypothetical protein
MKTRQMPRPELTALYNKVREVGFPMVTGDFEATQNLQEVRWLIMDHNLYQVDSIGDAIKLIATNNPRG